MPDQSQYAAAAHVPLIKSPSLRVPPPVQLPPDIHPLPDSVTPYFVYPFTIEPHILTLSSTRRQTLAAHEARRSAYLESRQRDKERRIRERQEAEERSRREALRRVAPGFEGGSEVLVPKRTSIIGDSTASRPTSMAPQERPKSVMEDLVDQLARLESNPSLGS